MADNLTSIHGRRLGLTASGMLSGADDTPAEQAFRGVEVGLRGRSHLASTSPRYVIYRLDDFLGGALDASWTTAKGSDGAASNFGILAGTPGGVTAAITGAGAGATMAANGVQLVGGRNFLVAAGPLAMEADIQPSAITTLNLFVGWSDTAIATLEAPFTIAGSVVTSPATNAVGLCFDTAATTATTQLLAVNGAGTPQQVVTSAVPDINAYHRYRVDLDAAGNASFFVDGQLLGPTLPGRSYHIAAAVAPSCILAPKITAFRRSAASATVNLDWVMVQQRLATPR